MKKRYMIAVVVPLAFGLLPQVQAATANWLLELVMVGIPQTQVVRDTLDRSKYYLCWTDGTHRYGVKFSRRGFDSRLGQVAPGGRAALSSVMTLDAGGWTPKDDLVCAKH